MLGGIILVLNDGMMVEEFVEKYDGEDLKMLNRLGDIKSFNINGYLIPNYQWQEPITKQDHRVWYNIMIGDNNCWAVERNLTSWVCEKDRVLI